MKGQVRYLEQVAPDPYFSVFNATLSHIPYNFHKQTSYLILEGKAINNTLFFLPYYSNTPEPT